MQARFVCPPEPCQILPMQYVLGGLLWGGAALVLVGCGGDDAPPAEAMTVSSRFALFDSPGELAEKTFHDHPFPSDLRMVDGRVVFAGYYNPFISPLLDEYIVAIDGVLDGFSPVAAGHLRFTGSIDPSTLPADRGASASPDASVQLIDVDPDSPERGERRRIMLHWRRDEGTYWRDSTLAFMPAVGFPLRYHTQYALVVTDLVRDERGGSLHASSELRQAIGLEDPSSAAASTAAEVYEPAVAEVERAGIARDRIVHLAVFTTNDPTEEMFAARDEVHRAAEPPDVLPGSWVVATEAAGHVEYWGDYGPLPNFQAGEVPYTKFGDGGGFVLEDGVPQIVNTFDARFSLTVPSGAACPMPADGYPIVLYAHGTTGNYRSYVSAGIGATLAERCMATMGVDQIFHGTRPGASNDSMVTQLAYFNFQNIEAARVNVRQSALDEVQRARLFTETQLVVPAAVSVTGADVRFDASRMLFFGHSQGGLNGPLFLAADDSVRGGVLSGASSVISITLLEKTSPAPGIAQVVQNLFLGLRGESVNELNLFHPPIALAQAIVDAMDPINYGRAAIQEPRDGYAAKSIYMTDGVTPDGSGDTFAPNRGIDALAMSYGLPLQQPFIWQSPDSAWGGLEPVTVPSGGLAGNLADGAASGILAQWPPAPGKDGHFVVFDVPAANAQATDFLVNLAADAKGRVPAP